MNGIIDITGQRFGRLVVLAYADKDKNRNARFLCLCDCGKMKIINGASLRKGLTQSCGCLQKEKAKTIFTTHGQTIGYRRSRLHSIWHGMKNRCLNPNTNRFKIYGGRGIRICKEWLNSFEEFYKWAINNGYDKNLTIDRINNNKGYEPSNCRWVTYSEQRRNQRPKEQQNGT